MSATNSNIYHHETKQVGLLYTHTHTHAHIHTQYFTFIKIWHGSFRIAACYAEIETKHSNTLCGQNTDVLMLSMWYIKWPLCCQEFIKRHRQVWPWLNDSLLHLMLDQCKKKCIAFISIVSVVRKWFVYFLVPPPKGHCTLPVFRSLPHESNTSISSL